MSIPTFPAWASRFLKKVAKGRKVNPRFDLGAFEIVDKPNHQLFTINIYDLWEEYNRLFTETMAVNTK